MKGTRIRCLVELVKHKFDHRSEEVQDWGLALEQRSRIQIKVILTLPTKVTFFDFWFPGAKMNTLRGIMIEELFYT